MGFCKQIGHKKPKLASRIDSLTRQVHATLLSRMNIFKYMQLLFFRSLLPFPLSPLLCLAGCNWSLFRAPDKQPHEEQSIAIYGFHPGGGAVSTGDRHLRDCQELDRNAGVISSHFTLLDAIVPEQKATNHALYCCCGRGLC